MHESCTPWLSDSSTVSNDTHSNESCHTRGCGMSHTWMSHVTMSHICTSPVPRDSVIAVPWLTTHIGMSPATHVAAVWIPHEWVTSHICTSPVTQIHESYHTCDCDQHTQIIYSSLLYVSFQIYRTLVHVSFQIYRSFLHASLHLDVFSHRFMSHVTHVIVTRDTHTNHIKFFLICFFSFSDLLVSFTCLFSIVQVSLIFHFALRYVFTQIHASCHTCDSENTHTQTIYSSLLFVSFQI